MKHLLCALFITALLTGYSFAGGFPSSAKEFMESSLKEKEIPSNYDIQEFKNEYASLISQIDSGEHEKAEASLNRVLNRSDVTYSEAYKSYKENRRDNIEDVASNFVNSIAFAAGKSTFEYGSIVAAAVVHFYPEFALGLISTDLHNPLFGRLLKLALYNAIQDEERFETISKSIRSFMEKTFSEENIEILNSWKWLTERDWAGPRNGLVHLLSESKYKMSDCPAEYKDRYERFYLWKWGRFDLVQRLSFLKNKYHYSQDALAALGKVEGLIIDNNIEGLKKYKEYFNKEYNYSAFGSTEDGQLGEIVSNVEKASRDGILFKLLPSSTPSSTPILGCEAAQVEVEQQPSVTTPENK